MIRFGIICPELSGHLNPMMAVARALEQRGHQVTFYQRLISKAKIESAGFHFRAFGEKEFPVERIKADLATLAQLSGLKALQFTIHLFARRMAVCIAEVPAMAREDRIDALLIDETTWEGASIAEQLGVPFVTFSNALVIHPEDRVPPFFTTWAYRDQWLARVRNRLSYRFFKRISGPLRRAVNEQRALAGQIPYGPNEIIGSKLLRISQQVAEFDFPRQNPPPNLHYVGPLVDANVRETVPFPFEKLNGKPLIYASLGTLQNRQQQMFFCIAAACKGLDAQLVISLGGGGKPESLGALPGNPITVEFAPQLELIRRSTLCITHAGLNTALESLSHGVPMVAIPITNDQPGVAARIKWSGCGEFIDSKKLATERLRKIVKRVMEVSSYSTNARRLKTAVEQSGGASEAASIVETAIGYR